ncbi:MAG TPA: DUF4097 family beta strand repeat-containing protein [Blastocatellia bacterium]
MSAKSMIFSSASLFILIALAGTAPARDFQRSYRVPAGGSIRIRNVSGDINITGYDGSTVNVSATIDGSTRNMVRIEDDSSGRGVDIAVRYPNNYGNCDASVRFQIEVPRSISFDFDDLGSVSGDITISDVAGRFHVSTVSGYVHAAGVSGSISAKSVSGDVQAELVDVRGSDDMRFTTVSGNVTFSVPASAAAVVEMTSLSGSLSTDFPLHIQSERFTSRKSCSGQIGSGGRHLHVSTVSGSICLRRLYSSQTGKVRIYFERPESSDWRRRDVDENRWVILADSASSFSNQGSGSDVDRARSVRDRVGGNLIWFVRDGREYIITDPAAIRIAQEVVAAPREEKDLESDLGAEQAVLARDRARLNGRQPETHDELRRLNDELHRIQNSMKHAASDEDLAELQERLSDVQSRISELREREREERINEIERQSEVAAQLNRARNEQSRLLAIGTRDLNAMLDKAVENGLARPAPQR